MQIYLAGKITGLDEDVAFRLFESAEAFIVAKGHTPLNPMKLVDQKPGREYFEYLFDALQIMIFQGEGVYFLSNWRDSKGAHIEHALPRSLIFRSITPRPSYPSAATGGRRNKYDGKDL
ncbi:MAG: DUF4406 domain-containing protein [Chloracidobacterium sp.]|nr:DUF4406 domain-containing protein [Chloracidobacterium sp.]